MKLNIIACDAATKQIASMSKDILECSFDGRKVASRKCDIKGYRIEYTEKDGERLYTVSYGDKPSLCRALLYLSSANEDSLTEPVTACCAFPEFGIMLDTARNAVPRMEAIRTMIRQCAFMGMNFVGLYIEDTLEIDGEPYFGYQRGRFTKAQIKEADEYAALFGLELIPFIQTLAHFTQLNRHGRYRAMMDIDDVLLVGEDETYELIDRILRTVSECFSSKKINIGMDEALRLGLGKYLNKHGFTKRSDIMKEHLERVLKLVRKYNFIPEMWSDMFFRLAFDGQYYIDDISGVSIPEIPSDITLCYWDYYSFKDGHYDKMLEAHNILSKNISFAGGAWKWMGFAPANRSSIRQGELNMPACRRFSLSRYTITMWGDDGAECSNFAVLPTLFDYSCRAFEDNMSAEAFALLTGISFEDFLCLDDANPYQDITHIRNTACKFLLYNDPLLGTLDSVVRDDTANEFKRSGEKLAGLSASDSQFAYIFDTLAKLCRVLELKADLGKRILKAYRSGRNDLLESISDAEIPEIIRRLESFEDAFRHQWQKENRSFGFEIQTMRLGGVKNRLSETAAVLTRFIAGELSEIEELEEERLPYDYYVGDEDTDIEDLYLNLWQDNIGPARL